MRHVEFPLAAADGVELFAGVEPKVVAAFRAGLAEEEWRQVGAVAFHVSERCAGEGGEGHVQIHGGKRGIADACGGDFARPTDQTGHAHAALEGGEFALAERSRRAGVFAVGEEGAIVGAENDERVVVEAEAFEGGHDLADGPIEFLDDIAVEAALAGALEFFGGEDGDVRHDVRHVEEKRFGAVTLDE